ncbi:hypothetical protein L1887_01090 [Cichorium endivia]|nr:hypothetical protein L1887_01090 [Cichorium endivia]
MLHCFASSRLVWIHFLPPPSNIPYLSPTASLSPQSYLNLTPIIRHHRFLLRSSPTTLLENEDLRPRPTDPITSQLQLAHLRTLAFASFGDEIGRNFVFSISDCSFRERLAGSHRDKLAK